MRTGLAMLFFVALVTTATAQTCEEICNDYKSFARRAGDPNTMAPLLKLYQACMECSRGAGNMNCQSITDPAHPGMRCDYNTNTAQPQPSLPQQE
jgi:hypothetical protein